VGTPSLFVPVREEWRFSTHRITKGLDDMEGTKTRRTAGVMALVTMALAAPAAQAQIKSAQTLRDEKMTEIPTCAKPLGTLAVEEPEGGVSWWTAQQLPAPSKLIKVFVAKSHCFTLVDRGAGLNQAMKERELGASGELRVQSNVGKGQIKAADYVMVPDLVSKNDDAAGGGVGGVLGGLMGSKVGRIASNVSFKTKTADVTLAITDVRSSEQVALAQGQAKKTDLGINASGALFGNSGVGGAGVGGYANTEMGQLITMAYLQAYTDLVGQLGGLNGNASASNAQQAVTVTKPGRLLANAKGTGTAVRTLDPGMMLYPTGTKDGMMWEVQDELGNKGWVSSTLIELSK